MDKTVAALFILVVLGCAQAFAEKRVALVIGNSEYVHATPLANPGNDASDMAGKLEDLGFEVVLGTNLDLNGMRRTVRDFVGMLDGADMAMFFYAGHGLQVNGQNYMAPIDARLSSYLDLDFEAMPINLIMSAMERATDVNLVFLDACRDNPLARNLSRSMGTRSGAVGRGLAKLGSGVGSLIAFATQPGNVALDGQGRNSPFTTALLEHLGTPGQDITRDLIHVRRAVLEATDGKQVPWDNSSLTGEIILKAKEAPPPEPARPDSQIEITFWNSIKDTNAKPYYESYLRRYPEGLFADIARLKIAELDAAASARMEAQKADSAAARRKAEQLAAQQDRIRQELAEQRAETLREAEEARKAAETARKEVEKRLAELAAATKRAEEQSKARAEQAARKEEETRLALLEQPAPDSAETPAVEDPKQDRELVRGIQSELNRIGCNVGGADGIWGGMTERGLRSFRTHAKVELASLEPSKSLLEKLKSADGRICPLVCGSGQELKGGRCVAVQTEKKVNTRTAGSACPSDPVEASRALWNFGILNTGDRKRRVHPCGRTLQCTGGVSGFKNSRSCRWLD